MNHISDHTSYCRLSGSVQLHVVCGFVLSVSHSHSYFLFLVSSAVWSEWECWNDACILILRLSIVCIVMMYEFMSLLCFDHIVCCCFVYHIHAMNSHLELTVCGFGRDVVVA